MPWNSTWPIGTSSVKNNRLPGQENTDYIKNTLRIDHYWDEGASFSGRHRQVSMQGTSSDLPLGPASGNMWYRLVSATIPRYEMFYRNVDNIYQVTPSFSSGSVVIGSSYVNVVDVNANCYGEIFLYTTLLGKYSVCKAIFRSDGTKVEAWSLYEGPEGSGASIPLKFGNGSDASGFFLRARTESASAGQTWNYRVTWRGL